MSAALASLERCCQGLMASLQEGLAAKGSAAAVAQLAAMVHDVSQGLLAMAGSGSGSGSRGDAIGHIRRLSGEPHAMWDGFAPGVGGCAPRGGGLACGPRHGPLDEERGTSTRTSSPTYADRNNRQPPSATHHPMLPCPLARPTGADGGDQSAAYSDGGADMHYAPSPTPLVRPASAARLSGPGLHTAQHRQTAQSARGGGSTRSTPNG